MIFVIGLLILLGLALMPTWWVHRVLARYSDPKDRYRERGSGGELARHLIGQFDLKGVTVEPTDETGPLAGDHYDPRTKTVRLQPAHYHGYSLAAISVAAHEVGHAIQHHRREGLFEWRTRLAMGALVAERVGAVLMFSAPLLAGITRIPNAGLLFVVAAVAAIGSRALVHLITLPVEWDASFNKALPILAEGNYLYSPDYPHARRILSAAAYTYLAGSLMSLINVYRWIRILRP
ncbi:MAG: zinc metallopeptidase [Candidatus Competibacterales bacterium]